MANNGVQPFFDAAKAVFSQMFGVDAKAGAPRTLEGSEDHGWEISGILGVAGSAQGVVAVRLPTSLVDELLKASGVETSGEQDRLATASGLVAEITNIIAGNAIGEYAGMDLDISPPVVIKGKNHQITWPKIAPVVAVVFSSSMGQFELAVCFNGA
jgi:CheY-specific phosphatase CheX